MHIITLLSSQDLDYSQKDVAGASQISLVYINNLRKYAPTEKVGPDFSSQKF